MEMTRPWKSAKSADSHRRLEKSRQKAARLSHIPTGSTGLLFLKSNRKEKSKNEVAHPGSILY
jgi:hypothetical protein